MPDEEAYVLEEEYESEYEAGFEDGYWAGYLAAKRIYGPCDDPDCPLCSEQ